jgi:DNA polymerase-4
MKSLNLHTGGDLKKLSEIELIKSFGKIGGFFYRIVRGIDERPVQPDRETKSIGAEDTFPVDLFTAEQLYAELNLIADIVHRRLTKHQMKGRTITLKIKYSSFKIITRSFSFALPQCEKDVIFRTAKDLLDTTLPAPEGIRLMGITVSNFLPAPVLLAVGAITTRPIDISS